MKNKKLFALLLVMTLALGLLTVSALADAGNFSGSSDYGGGGWSGGSDWGSSDYGGSSVIFFGGGGGGGAISLIITVVVIILIFVAIGKKKGGTAYTPVRQATPPSNLSPIASLSIKDPGFSEAAFKEKISNLYVRMQNAWQDKDFEPMRPYMTDALYSQFDRQLQELVRSGCTNYVERIAVLDVTLEGWREDETNQTISALVNTRITDYTVNDGTGKVVSGSKTAEKFMCYRWTLIRSAGMTTPEHSGQGSDSVHCPSCGAPLEVNHSAKCPYCGSLVSAKDYDWCISSISGISQRTSK